MNVLFNGFQVNPTTLYEDIISRNPSLTKNDEEVCCMLYSHLDNIFLTVYFLRMPMNYSILYLTLLLMILMKILQNRSDF